MNATMRRHLAAWVVATLALFLAWPGSARADATGQKVDEHVQKLAEYLLSQQQADGTFALPSQPAADAAGFTEYRMAAAMLGLGFAGLTAEDERVQRGLDAMMFTRPDTTESVAHRISALVWHLEAMKPAQRKRAQECIEEDVTRLITAQDGSGRWGFQLSPTRYWTTQTTCMAARALIDAQEAAMRMKSSTFEPVVKNLMDHQSANGGWVRHFGMMGFGGQDRIRAVDTAAGVEILLNGRRAAALDAGCPCGGRGKSKDGWGGVDLSADRAVRWLAQNFNPGENTGSPDVHYFRRYWLYCCGRAMMAGGYKYLGTHDWYKEGIAELLTRGFPANDSGDWLNVVEAAYRIGFLRMCREPLLVNKLEFHGPWNQHPHDALSLAMMTGKTRGKPHRWQRMDLTRDLADFQEAPLLLISAEDDILLNAEEKKLLRRYTDTGGTVLCEAACGNVKAMRSLERLIGEVWPEWKLATLDKDHAFWTADAEIKGRLPVLRCLHDGVRPVLFLATQDLTCGWVAADEKKNAAACQTAQNLVAVATDLSPLPGRYDDPEPDVAAKYPGRQLKRGGREKVTLARLRHSGCWDAGRNYGLWGLLSADLSARASLTVEELEPLSVGDAAPTDLTFLYLTGRGPADLGEGGAEWLKTYLAGGGFLLAEATCGDEAFDASLRSLAEAAGLTLKPLEADSPLISGDLFGAAGYAIAKVKLTRAAGGQGDDPTAAADPVLFRIEHEGKLVGLYSPLDILYSQSGYRAFGNRGYSKADARALATNIALLMSVK